MISPNGESEWLDGLAGVLKADTLAPNLFITALYFALGQAINGNEELGFLMRRRQSRRKRSVCIAHLDFANNIALISEQVKQAHTLLDSVEKLWQQQ